MSEVFAAAATDSNGLREEVAFLRRMVALLISRIPEKGAPTLEEELELTKLRLDEAEEKLAFLAPRVGS